MKWKSAGEHSCAFRQKWEEATKLRVVWLFFLDIFSKMKPINPCQTFMKPDQIAKLGLKSHRTAICFYLLPSLVPPEFARCQIYYCMHGQMINLQRHFSPTLPHTQSGLRTHFLKLCRRQSQPKKKKKTSVRELQRVRSFLGYFLKYWEDFVARNFFSF